MKVNNKFKKGFTLVELVVVIAVIAILAAVSVGAYFGVTDSANDSKLTSESANIKLNITLLGSEGNSYCNINKDYLEINNITLFNEELNKDTGISYNVLINGTGNIDNSNDPIINFIGINNSDTKFDYFEYSTSDIVNKYIKVNLISGESEIIKGNIEINDNDNPTGEPDIEVEETITRDVEKTGNVRFNFPVINEPQDQYVGIKIFTEEFNVVSGEYTLSLKDLNNCYSDAYNSRKTGVFKVGDLENAGSFSFSVPSEVKSVIIRVGTYKFTTESMISINDEEAMLITHMSTHNNFEAIEVTTLNNKTVSFKTILDNEKAHRIAYISSIEYVL